jgi:hypothetical protein
MDHDWEERPLKDKKKHSFEYEGNSGCVVVICLDIDFTLMGIESLRVCRLCGQESVDSKIPAESCENAQIRRTMES